MVMQTTIIALIVFQYLFNSKNELHVLAQLGHHRLPDNKFNAYEHTLRIPLLIRGPGITPAGVDHRLGTQVDFAPTFLSMAGAPHDPGMDGHSLLPQLVALQGTVSVALPPPTRRRLEDGTHGVADWRDHHLTVWYNHVPRYVVLGECEDDWSNTYLATFVNSTQFGAWKLAVFDPEGKQTGFARPNHYELFNMSADPYELDNVWDTTTPELRDYLNATIYRYYGCSGSARQSPNMCP